MLADAYQTQRSSKVFLSFIGDAPTVYYMQADESDPSTGLDNLSIYLLRAMRCANRVGSG